MDDPAHLVTDPMPSVSYSWKVFFIAIGLVLLLSVAGYLAYAWGTVNQSEGKVVFSSENFTRCVGVLQIDLRYRKSINDTLVRLDWRYRDGTEDIPIAVLSLPVFGGPPMPVNTKIPTHSFIAPGGDVYALLLDPHRMSINQFNAIAECMRENLSSINGAIAIAQGLVPHSSEKWRLGGVAYISSTDFYSGMNKLNTDGIFVSSNNRSQIDNNGRIFVGGYGGDIFSGLSSELAQLSPQDKVSIGAQKNKRGEDIFTYVERMHGLVSNAW